MTLSVRSDLNFLHTRFAKHPVSTDKTILFLRLLNLPTVSKILYTVELGKVALLGTKSDVRAYESVYHFFREKLTL